MTELYQVFFYFVLLPMVVAWCCSHGIAWHMRKQRAAARFIHNKSTTTACSSDADAWINTRLYNLQQNESFLFVCWVCCLLPPTLRCPSLYTVYCLYAVGLRAHLNDVLSNAKMIDWLKSHYITSVQGVARMFGSADGVMAADCWLCVVASFQMPSPFLAWHPRWLRKLVSRVIFVLWLCNNE